MTTEQEVRKLEPRMHLKLMRNHFGRSPAASPTAWRQGGAVASFDTRSEPRSASQSGFFSNRGVDTTTYPKPLSASLWAAQRERVYRFGKINAVYNPRKIEAGDDLGELEE